MKTTFIHHAHFARMLTASGLDEPKIKNAVQSTLNSAGIVDGSEAHKRGNVKGVSKDVEFEFNETSQIKYRGKSDAPANWAKYHDAQVAVWKKHGEPSGELTLDSIPVIHRDWLVLKCAIANGKTATEGKTDKPQVAPASVRKNGNIESVAASK